MERAGVTQGQVAEACGVSGPAVNQWLTGKTKGIDPKYVAEIAALTGTSPQWLMTGKGSEKRRARDPLSSAERQLLGDYRRLTPRVRVEVGRLVGAIAGAS